MSLRTTCENRFGMLWTSEKPAEVSAEADLGVRDLFRATLENEAKDTDERATEDLLETSALVVDAFSLPVLADEKALTPFEDARFEESFEAGVLAGSSVPAAPSSMPVHDEEPGALPLRSRISMPLVEPSDPFSHDSVLPHMNVRSTYSFERAEVSEPDAFLARAWSEVMALENTHDHQDNAMPTQGEILLEGADGSFESVGVEGGRQTESKTLSLQTDASVLLSEQESFATVPNADSTLSTQHVLILGGSADPTLEVTSAVSSTTMLSQIEDALLRWDPNLSTAMSRKIPERLTVELRPETLGSVEISFDFSLEGHVRVVVQTEQASTHDLLRRDSDTLLKILQGTGLNIAQGDLSFRQQTSGQTFYETKHEPVEDREAEVSARIQTPPLISITEGDHQINLYV